MLKPKIKGFFFPFILIFIAIISHLEWVNFNSILASGDWLYVPDEHLRSLLNYGSWLSFNNLGAPNIQIYFNIFEFPWCVFQRIGIDYDIASKLNLFLPIAILGFISPYLLSKKIINNHFIAFISALFYGTTTYFLGAQAGHIPVAFVYSITPLIFLVLIKALEKNTLVYWLSLAIIYSIGVGYEVRIMYIVSFILLLYFLCFHLKDLRKYFKKLLYSCLLIFALNLYWILPTLLGGISGSIENIAGRGLFGDSLMNVLRASTISTWNWTGGFPNRNFDPQPILIYFWILPIFIFSIFLFKNNRYQKRLLFFLGILLLGILLVKQSAPPFTWFYPFLRDYFPGFILFRESSKFYLIVAFGYLGLLVYGLRLLSEKLKNRKIWYFALCSLLIVIFLWNLRPLITKEYRTLFVSREIPKAYLNHKSYILLQDQSYRTLWIPDYSQWSFYTIQNPRISFVGLTGSNWKSLVDYHNSDITTGQRLIDLLNRPFMNQLLDVSSIKYVIVPLQDKTDLENKLFDYYGETRDFYIKELDKLQYLQKVSVGTEDLVVYENEDYRPRAYITNNQESMNEGLPYNEVDFRLVNSYQYGIKIKKVKEAFYLNISESYHKNWGLRVGSFDWLNVFFDKKYFVSEKYHFQNEATLNSYFIDPKSICSQFICEQNKDGSYNINLTFYFKSQSWFYLGAIISLITLFLIVFFLLLALIKNLYGKKEK